MQRILAIIEREMRRYMLPGAITVAIFVSVMIGGRPSSRASKTR